MLPEGIPTVTVTGRYLRPNGTPLTGQVVFRAPSLITFPDHDVIVGGPVTAPLDTTGAFTVALPATDAPGMNPAGWSYAVAEQFATVAQNRVYQIVLPSAVPEVDIADIAPTDPTTPNYVAVPGLSAYEVAVAGGYVGTETEWLASLVGPAGSVDTVNGAPGPDVVLTAADVGAAATGHTHTPASIGAAETGHAHTAASVGAIPAAEKGAAGGVATLGADGLLTLAQRPPSVAKVVTAAPYGAIGNGIADDAPAIQQALNGGGWVVVPPGTYKLATLPLRTYRNTRLTLMPGATFVRAAGATMLLNGDAGQDFSGYSGHGNLIIEGGVWDMQATAAGLTDSRMCISLGHARDIVVRDLTVLDTPGFHAIEANACKNVTVERCRFLGFVDPGGRSTSEAVQLDLAAGSGYFGGFGPYDFTPCEDITVRDCLFGASGTPGTTAWPRGVGSHSAIIGRWHKRIRVDGCTFEGLLREGVRTYAWEDVTVSGCAFTGCATGVQSRTVDTARTADTVNTSGVQTGASQAQSGLVITGNTFSSITGAGDEGAIFVQGEATGKALQTTITGNIIRGVSGGKSGIRLQHAQRAVVSGNSLTAIAGTAISQDTVDGTLIAGNRIHDATLAGVSANTGTDVEVADNHITTCGTNGVHIVAGVNSKIANNYIRGAGRTDGNGYGIRVTTSSASTTITGNTYRKFGSGNEAANALSITGGNTGVRRWGNDWIGQGNSTDVNDLSTTPNLSPYDAGTP